MPELGLGQFCAVPRSILEEAVFSSSSCFHGPCIPVSLVDVLCGTVSCLVFPVVEPMALCHSVFSRFKQAVHLYVLPCGKKRAGSPTLSFSLLLCYTMQCCFLRLRVSMRYLCTPHTPSLPRHPTPALAPSCSVSTLMSHARDDM